LGLDLAGVKMSMNPLDEIAVEEAVRLKVLAAVSKCALPAVRVHFSAMSPHIELPRACTRFSTGWRSGSAVAGVLPSAAAA
jgi:hypothetical protein